MSRTEAKKDINRSSSFSLAEKRTLREVVDNVYNTSDTLNSGKQAAMTSGTFTPTIQDASASDAEGQTYDTQSGVWRRLGDVVDVWVEVKTTSIGTLAAAEQVYITGLPVAASGNAAGAVGYTTGMAVTDGEAPSAMILDGEDWIRLYEFQETTGSGWLTCSNWSNTGHAIIHISYIAAS
jgi:hypothetical protein